MKADAFLHALRGAGGVEIGRPLPPSQRARWKARHPECRLPNDFLGFLKRANGLRFAAGRLLPLAEIRPVTEQLFQDMEGEDEALPADWLGLTEDEERVLIFDVRRRLYLTLDPEAPDDTEELGDAWETALDWLYARYAG